MTTTASFAKWVRPFVPGCPEAILLDAIQQAAIEFCSSTLLFNETMQITTAAGVAAYALPVSTGREPVQVEYVKRNGFPLTPTSRREADLKVNTAQNQPKEYYLNGLLALVLVTTPIGIETLDVAVIVAPSSTSATLPDELMLEQRYLAIAAGALASLLMSPYPWANAQAGALERIKFDQAIAEEQLKRSKGTGTKRLRTRGTYF